MVTDSQLVRAADHAENDVTDSQLVKAVEQAEEMDYEDDELLCRALDEEMERQGAQPMYGGGAPPPPGQAPPVQVPPVQPPGQAPPAQPPVQVPPVQPPVQAPPAQPAVPAPPAQPAVHQAALNDTARRVTFYPVNQLDILQSMNELELHVTDLLQHEREQHIGIKWYMALTVEYSKLNLEGE